MDIISIYMSFISKSAGHFGQKSGLIGHWPADMDLSVSYGWLNSTKLNPTKFFTQRPFAQGALLLPFLKDNDITTGAPNICCHIDHI